MTIIRPPGPLPRLNLGELWQYRAICLVLAKRSLKARYRQAFLGVSWTILQPILLMIVFTVFFGLFARVPTEGLPHPVFYFLGLLPWQIVARIVNEGSLSVVANAALVTRVYFPRVYLPLATAISALVDFAFGLVALVILLVAFGASPSVGLLAVPLLLVIALATSLGVAMWLAALNAAYRDVTQLLPSLVQLWFFASPVLYPSTIIPEAFRGMYYLNPMAVVIDGFRWAFAGARVPPSEAWLAGVFVAVLLLVSGYVFYRQREQFFADVV